jgi:hypothetical protein
MTTSFVDINSSRVEAYRYCHYKTTVVFIYLFALNLSLVNLKSKFERLERLIVIPKISKPVVEEVPTEAETEDKAAELKESDKQASEVNPILFRTVKRYNSFFF